MLRRQARDKAQLNRLMGDGKGTRNHRLAGDKGCRRCQQHQRQLQRLRGHVEERAFHHHRSLRRIKAGNHCALTEIIEQQARHDKAKPRQAHRPPAKVSHIRIQRL